jgi:beta-N-acetylhexosaminidase
VAGPCTGRLIPPRVRVEGPSDVVATFDATMAARGVTIAHDTRKRVRDGFKTHVVKGKTTFVKRKVTLPSGKKVKRRVPKFRWVTVRADAPTVALVGPSGGTPGPSDVLVALDRPSVLGRSRARVELATYGESGASFRALADVLMGVQRAPGHLPLDVPGVSREGC